MKVGTDEDLAKLPAVIGFSGTRWPAAERAGLVNVGGMWMSPGNAEKFREHWRKKNAETRAELERKERGE